MSSTDGGVDRPTGPADGQRRAMSVRAVAVGALGATLICGLVPFNDYVLNNTFIVGSYLGVGLTLALLTLTLLVNAPLRKLNPKLAFNGGEMVVILAMLLVACAIPSSGLMRYLPSTITGGHWYASQDPSFARVFEAAE